MRLSFYLYYCSFLAGMLRYVSLRYSLSHVCRLSHWIRIHWLQGPPGTVLLHWWSLLGSGAPNMTRPSLDWQFLPTTTIHHILCGEKRERPITSCCSAVYLLDTYDIGDQLSVRRGKPEKVPLPSRPIVVEGQVGLDEFGGGSMASCKRHLYDLLGYKLCMIVLQNRMWESSDMVCYYVSSSKAIIHKLYSVISKWFLSD